MLLEFPQSSYPSIVTIRYICILAEVVEILYNASDNYVEYVKMDSFVVSLYIVPKITLSCQTRGSLICTMFYIGC